MASGCTVQKGSTTMASGDTSVTQAITSVTTTQSFIIATVKQGDTTNSIGLNQQGIANVTYHFSATNQLTFTRAASGFALVIEWFVVSFSSGVTVQHGYYDNLADSDTDITITSVNTAKTFVIVSSYGHTNYGFNKDNDIIAFITSSTNLRIRASTSGPWTDKCRYQVIEYDNATVQVAPDTLSGTSDETSLGSSVDVTKSFIAPTSRDNSDCDNGNVQWNAYLESDKVKYVRTSDPGTFTTYYNTFVVSISDNIKVTRFQSVLGAAVTSLNVTVDIKDTTKAFIFGDSQWFKSSGKTSDAGNNFSRACAAKINSTVEVNISRAGTETDEITFYWELIEFERTDGNWPLLQMKNELYNCTTLK